MLFKSIYNVDPSNLDLSDPTDPKLPLELLPKAPIKFFVHLTILVFAVFTLPLLYFSIAALEVNSFESLGIYCLFFMSLFYLYKKMIVPATTNLRIDLHGITCTKKFSWKLAWHEIETWSCIHVNKEGDRILIDTKAGKMFWIPLDISQKDRNLLKLFFCLKKHVGLQTPFASRCSWLRSTLSFLNKPRDVYMDKDWEEFLLMVNGARKDLLLK